MDKKQNKQHFDLSHHSNAKIGVLSDTHCYIDPSVVSQLEGCDVILHAGDIGSIEVIKQLKSICDDVISVCGNNDNELQWQEHEHAELKNIPQIAEVGLSGGMITITHGDEYFSDYDIWHQELRNNFSNSKAIIYGHSHKMVCDQSDQPWVLNPGASGETRIQRHGVSCLLIHTNNENWKVEEFRA